MTYIPKENRQEISNDDIIAINIVVNGPLGMGAGKIAAKAFQANHTLREAYPQAMKFWEEQGLRTIVRIAETPAVFDRACRELVGVIQYDEGLTEVPAGSACLFVTIPLRRGSQPKILKHKKLQLL